MMEALRRGCESDPQSQQPAKTGGVCADLAGAKYRFTFLRSGESPLSKKVKVYLLQITSG